MGNQGFSTKAASELRKATLATAAEDQLAMNAYFAKKKPHHKPMPLERNGFSTIVMHIDAVRRGAVLDMDLIERTARVGIRYIDALAAGQMPMWSDLTACVVCGTREGHLDVNSFCDGCNAKNHVAGDHE